MKATITLTKPIRLNRGREAIQCGFAVFLSFLNLSFFAGCAGPIQSEQPAVSWDTSCIIGGISFPNDSIYQRAVVDPGNSRRIHRFLDKCAQRSSVRVGFIGGSITYGAMASVATKRYSSVFCSSIKHLFPKLENVIEINAGISSTGSRFGCSRLKTDVLDSVPDMIIIEFAVNDYGTGDSMYIRECMEGLVRQCLAYKNDVPVLLLFMSKGDGSNVQDLHADVGRYYNLPMISYRDAIWPLVERNWAMFDTFFHDDPHPNDNGHFLCGYLLYSFLKNALWSKEDADQALAPYRYSDLYQYAGIVTSADTVVRITGSGWNAAIDKSDRVGARSSIDGARLILKGNFRELGLGLHMQPSDNSSIQVIVDAGSADSTINDYHVIEYTKIVRLVVSDSTLPHAAEIVHLGGSPFVIDYILYAKKP